MEEIDFKMLQIIDEKRSFFLEIPRHSAPLRRAMREAYFQHVYHTVAIEGTVPHYSFDPPWTGLPEYVNIGAINIGVA